MTQAIRISDYVSSESPLRLNLPPWEACAKAAELVESLFANLSSSYKIIGHGIAAHDSATIEEGAVLKAPCIVGENCFVAAYAYLRGGVWLDSNCRSVRGNKIVFSFWGKQGGAPQLHWRFHYWPECKH